MRSKRSQSIHSLRQAESQTPVYVSQHPHPPPTQNNQMIQTESISSISGMQSSISQFGNPLIDYSQQFLQFHKFYNQLKCDFTEITSACEDAISRKYEVAAQQLPQEIKKQIKQIGSMKQYSFKFISQLHEQNQSLICKLTNDSYRISFERKNKRANNYILENQKNSSKDMEELEKQIYEGNIGKVAQMIMVREEDKERNDKKVEKFTKIKSDIDDLLSMGKSLLKLHPRPIPAQQISQFHQQSSSIKSQLHQILSYFSCHKQSHNDLKHPERGKLKNLETYLGMNKRIYKNLSKDYDQIQVLLKPNILINSDIRIQIEQDNKREGYGEQSQINISCNSSQVSN